MTIMELPRKRTFKCDEPDCEFVSESKVGISAHKRFGHTDPIGPVEVLDFDLTNWPDEQLPTITPPGLWKTVKAAPLAAFAAVAWVAIGANAFLFNSITIGVGLVLMTPMIYLGAVYFITRGRLITVYRIKPPLDAKAEVRILKQFWPAKYGRYFPAEAKWSINKRSVYFIDELDSSKPVIFNPFAAAAPDYAIPSRGAMVNQQLDNEALNVGHYKGIRPEVIKYGFAGIVIAGLLFVNFTMFSQLLEYLK